ncbi:MAG: HEAT repeat domain-containing protein [Gammaproteobacteria bacterium]|nr:HEAT repeat domain-containing protein [Gammaproteobacteria bacterium]
MGVLSQIRTDRLIGRLLSEDNVNSSTSNEIVGKLRREPASAITALFARLDQAPDDEFRNIVAGLYRLLNDDTLEYYIDALRSGHARKVRAVAKILGSSGRFNPNRLIPLIADADIPKSTLIKSLSEHQKRLNPELLLRYATQLETAEHHALFKVIGNIAQPSIVPRLLNRTTAADPSIRAHVTELLARFPSTQTARALEERLADENRSVRMAAIEGLANAGIQPNIATLGRLLKDPDLAIQSRAIDAIIRLKHPDTINHLLPILQDESEYVRRAGVEVLNEIADASLISNLLTAMRDEDWWVRERAADALSRIGGPRVVESMLELIKSDDEYIRRTAIEVINASRDPRAYDHLIAALADEDWWVKERAVDALAALGAEQRRTASAARA